MAEKRMLGADSSHVSVTYRGGTELDICTAESQIKGYLPREDAFTPSESGEGSNPGMRPAELLLGAFGSCVSGLIIYYALRHGYALDAVTTTLEDRVVMSPIRISEITINVSLEGDLTPEQREKLYKLADRCKIGNTLKNLPEVVFSFDDAVKTKVGT